jgi:molybdenum storage protein
MSEVPRTIQTEIPHRRTIQSPLSGQTLEERDLLTSVAYDPPMRVLPDVNVIKVGGQSFFDRGKAAVWPIVEEIAACAQQHQLIVGMGGGTRSRHAYSIGLELGLPTGIIAAIGASTSLQNTHLMQMLLAKHGGILTTFEEFEKLPLYLKVGCIPIMVGMPPFHHWERPPVTGRIPANRTDAGVYLMAEFLGARSMIYVKDEDGLYTDDPKKHPEATFIPKISAQELLDMDLNDLVIERVVLEYMQRATHVREIQIVNGLKHGRLTRALAGEHVGTIIYV